MRDYHINVFYSEEDGGYIADIPDLPHCAAFGETQEQALATRDQASISCGVHTTTSFAGKTPTSARK